MSVVTIRAASSLPHPAGWSPRRESGHTNNPWTLYEAVSGVGTRRVIASSRRSLVAIMPANRVAEDPTFSVSSDAHRVRRARRRPPRTTRLLQGMSRRIAMPATPWVTAAHRPLGDPVATVATPVPNTSRRATRRVWLVTLAEGGRRIARNPATLRTRAAPGRGRDPGEPTRARPSLIRWGTRRRW